MFTAHFKRDRLKIGTIMTTITFDTHKFVRKLKEAGIPESQAEAISEAFKDAQGEADLATKRDIDDVRRDMREMEQRLIIKLGALVAFAIGIVAVLVKLL
jgi:hypothetical protein